MLRHVYITQNLELIPPPHRFERFEKYVSRFWRSEMSPSLIATEGDEVVFAFVLITL